MKYHFLSYLILTYHRIGSGSFSAFPDVEAEWPMLLENMSANNTSSSPVRSLTYRYLSAYFKHVDILWSHSVLTLFSFLIYSFSSFFCLFICSFILLLIHLFIDLFVELLICQFLFIHSFIYLFKFLPIYQFELIDL